MSWYVRYLLLNSDEIRESAENPLQLHGISTREDSYSEELMDDEPIYSDDYGPFSLDNNIYENDFFNDLLIVEKKIKELSIAGVLSGKDLDLIKIMSSDPVMYSLSTPLGVGRFSIEDRFNLITNLISKSLGSIFTDEGYVEYLTEKYHLDEKRVKILKEFIANNIKI